MTELLQWLLNPFLHYLVWGIFWAYCLYHQYMIGRFIRLNRLSLRFFDRLLLFRIPIWRASIHIAGDAIPGARYLAWQFTIAFSLLLSFYLVIIGVAFIQIL